MIDSKLDIQVWRLLSSCCCLKLRHHIEIEEAGDKGTRHLSNRLVIVSGQLHYTCDVPR